MAGKYQALFFYHVYRLDVEAYGLADCHLASLCAKDGTPCNLEQFMRRISKIKPQKPTARGKTPGSPDFSKVNWARIGEGSDLFVLRDEIDKSGFSGAVYNEKLFQNWDATKDRFDTVMEEARKIATNAIEKFKADGRKLPDNRIDIIERALETHANARCADLANHTVADFEKFANANRISVRYTDYIEREPVEGYRKIDVDRIIEEKKDKPNFDSLKKDVENFVRDNNSKKPGQPHLRCIEKADCVLGHIAEACRK